MLDKFARMLERSELNSMDLANKFVAIKMHLGEPGNTSIIRPVYVKTLVDFIRERGGKPFLTDCNTLYVGGRKNALDHIDSAYLNGFSPLTVGAHVIIADGLKGTDEVEVPLEGMTYCPAPKIGRALMDADVVVSLTHFKGHEEAGFGGALKNIGMGGGSRAGKMEQHAAGKPVVDPDSCVGCRQCAKSCAHGAITFSKLSQADKAPKAAIDHELCVGCGRCIGACNQDAVEPQWDEAREVLNHKIAEYTLAVVKDRPCFHISLVMDVSPSCDCNSHSDTPIVPNVGIFCGLDPVALDQACADAVNAAPALQNTALTDAAGADCHQDEHGHFHVIHPETCWEEQLVHGERIGLGTRKYELVRVG
ncbi:DUF362 domain-containing protein [uncultured Oscillibacter sp.]|uniref:DUF362 domain-containing protein n=1 Tax=uncultured Oscillibacter sp. TaxID=876091 RepID=UPI00261B4E0A|nr:DUF362 domain-containing protein [uncultured Oscillibacter sp.]